MVDFIDHCDADLGNVGGHNDYLNLAIWSEKYRLTVLGAVEGHW